MPKPATISAMAASRQGDAGSAAMTSSMRTLPPGSPGGEQREGQQQEGLAENGEGHVDRADALRVGLAFVTIIP